MRTVANKDIISMLLLRRYQVKKRFELCENSDQKTIPYLMKSEKGIIG